MIILKASALIAAGFILAWVIPVAVIVIQEMLR